MRKQINAYNLKIMKSNFCDEVHWAFILECSFSYTIGSCE